MQDVIFAGSDSRGPLGLAEVTLTFDTEGGDVPPQYAAYSEISITRRLHRDGTSEYLINNVQMRLRDITDLFLGTGVCEKSFLPALDVMRLYNPSPLFSMLVARRWGGLPPAKKRFPFCAGTSAPSSRQH